MAGPTPAVHEIDPLVSLHKAAASCTERQGASSSESRAAAAASARSACCECCRAWLYAAGEVTTKVAGFQGRMLNSEKDIDEERHETAGLT